MSIFKNLKILLKKHYIIHFHNYFVPFHQNHNIFIPVFTNFYKVLQEFFLFYDSKTSKPHAFQSYSSGANANLWSQFCGILSCYWICYQKCKFAFRSCYDKMDRKWVNERWSLSWFGNIIYIVLQYMLFICYL